MARNPADPSTEGDRTPGGPRDADLVLTTAPAIAMLQGKPPAATGNPPGMEIILVTATPAGQGGVPELAPVGENTCLCDAWACAPCDAQEDIALSLLASRTWADRQAGGLMLPLLLTESARAREQGTRCADPDAALGATAGAGCRTKPHGGPVEAAALVCSPPPAAKLDEGALAPVGEYAADTGTARTSVAGHAASAPREGRLRIGSCG